MKTQFLLQRIEDLKFLYCLESHKIGNSSRLAMATLMNYFRNQKHDRWHSITITGLTKLFANCFSDEVIRVSCQLLTDLGIIKRRRHCLNPRAWQYCWIGIPSEYKTALPPEEQEAVSPEEQEAVSSSSVEENIEITEFQNLHQTIADLKAQVAIREQEIKELQQSLLRSSKQSETVTITTTNQSALVPEPVPGQVQPLSGQYLTGPWLDDDGRLNDCFVDWQAHQWEKSAFGGCTHEYVKGKVRKHYRKPEYQQGIADDWDAFVETHQRYITNVQSRIKSGGSTIETEEQEKIRKLAPVMLRGTSYSLGAQQAIAAGVVEQISGFQDASETIDLQNQHLFASKVVEQTPQLGSASEVVELVDGKGSATENEVATPQVPIATPIVEPTTQGRNVTETIEQTPLPDRATEIVEQTTQVQNATETIEIKNSHGSATNVADHATVRQVKQTSQVQTTSDTDIAESIKIAQAIVDGTSDLISDDSKQSKFTISFLKNIAKRTLAFYGHISQDPTGNVNTESLER